MYNIFMSCEIVLKRPAILFELPMILGRGVAGGGLLILVAGYAGVDSREFWERAEEFAL